MRCVPFGTPNGNLNQYFAVRNVKLHVVVVVAKLYRQLEMASIETVEDAKGTHRFCGVFLLAPPTGI